MHRSHNCSPVRTDLEADGAKRIAAAHVVNMPKLLTEEEAAEFLQIPVRTLQSWRYRKQGPAYVKMGHAVRYRVELLDTWVDQHIVEPGGVTAGGS